MGTQLHAVTGPNVEKKGDLAAILTNLQPRDVLFIDEVHRLQKTIEEVLYGAMEDFKLDLIIGQGPAARTLRIDLPRFTLVGATTRTGLLSSPLRDRFGVQMRLDFYPAEELQKIVQRSAGLLGIGSMRAAPTRSPAARAGLPGSPTGCSNACATSPRSARGAWASPRASRARSRARRWRFSRSTSAAWTGWTASCCITIIDKFDGGPVGIETLSSALGEERDTLEDVYEPFLIQEGLIQRTPRGRVATAGAFRHLGREQAPTGAETLPGLNA